MLYIFTLGQPVQLSSSTLSAGSNPNGFVFGVLSDLTTIGRDDDDTLVSVLQFQGRTWQMGEETSSLRTLSDAGAVSEFINGRVDALIASEAQALELAQRLADPDQVVDGNAGLESLLVYQLASASSPLLRSQLPAAENEITGTAAGETLTGTAARDIIDGLSGNDIIFGGAGSDEITGGPGDDVLIAGSATDNAPNGDVAVFAGPQSLYTFTGGSDYAVVTAADGTRDKLFGFETLRFADGDVTLEDGSALDGLGAPEDFLVAERVALLYEAALNRDGNIDLPGLNFYIDVTERDALSDVFLAENLMTSPEFTQTFGDVENMTNGEFLEQIYLNVLDRPSDAAGRQFYLDLLDAGTISKALALADIAISPENAGESLDILRNLHESAPGEWAFL
ncbi:MAG: DUF4214 domain-containing protein [Pseudomonadota bacterium]